MRPPQSLGGCRSQVRTSSPLNCDETAMLALILRLKILVKPWRIERTASRQPRLEEVRCQSKPRTD